MDPFYLSHEPQPDGFTHIVYDIGPAERAIVMVPTIIAHDVLAIPAIDLIGGTLADVRPATNRRRKWQ